jgi:hypothetical protein
MNQVQPEHRKEQETVRRFLGAVLGAVLGEEILLLLVEERVPTLAEGL